MVRLELPSTPECGMLVRALLMGMGAALAWDGNLVDALKTAVTAACNNVVMHAYHDGHGPLAVRVTATHDTLDVLVRDHGDGIDPARQDPDGEGLGLVVIQSLADRSELGSVPGGGTEVRALTSDAAVIGAVPADAILGRLMNGRWQWPTSALLSGLIVALALGPETSRAVALYVGALASGSKYVLRTSRGHVFNPAALALVWAPIAFGSGESWWGALGDAPDRFVQLAISLPARLGGSLARHERSVLVAGQLAHLPQPPHRVPHLLRAPRSGDRVQQRAHRQAARPRRHQRRADVLADRYRAGAHLTRSSATVMVRRPPAIGATNRAVPSAGSPAQPSRRRTRVMACSRGCGGLW